MAYVNTTRVVAPVGGLRARISTLLADFGDRRARYRLYRQTVSELNNLSARELADLGLHRSQITAVALESAYGK